MSDDTNINEAKPNSGKSPSHYAYHVRKAGDRSFWTKYGVAFQHTDGKGFNILLDGFPLDGAITLRVPSEKK